MNSDHDVTVSRCYEIDVFHELFGRVLLTAPRHPIRICIQIGEILYCHECIHAGIDETLGIHELGEIVNKTVLVFDRGDGL